ncbi:MAG: lipase family protein [Clostridia bacterium]|nr:lipase family protein [Clostridia bacterium]
MKRIKIIISFLLIFAFVLSFSSCELFEDETPDTTSSLSGGSTAAVVTDEIVTTESTSVNEPKYSEISIDIPNDCSVFDKEFAIELLSLCGSQNKNSQKAALENVGFEVIIQNNYEKSKEDSSHTCAYTIACGTDSTVSPSRSVIIVCVRGTSNGEWYSNFDFAPSHSDSTRFAENFLACAQDVYTALKPVIDENPGSEVIVCGHSRGAACSNLLGYLLNEDNVPDCYVYTFATPTTVRGEHDNSKYSNIFNVINSSDIVTYLPLASMGFYRLGTDIVLSGTASLTERVASIIDSLSTVSSGVSSYYNDKHSTDKKGLSDDGVTVKEVMDAVCSALFIGGGAEESMKLLSSLSADSDFGPVVSLMSEFSSETSMMYLLISAQHMPSAYINQLSSY